MGILSKRFYKIMAVIAAAVMLLGLVTLAAADGGFGNLPQGLLIGIAGVSGAAAVFAARKGWRP